MIIDTGFKLPINVNQTQWDSNSVSWVTPNNITTISGSTYAQITLEKTQYSHLIYARNYQFNIPMNSEIIGIEAELTGTRNSGTQAVSLAEIYLTSWNGVNPSSVVILGNSIEANTTLSGTWPNDTTTRTITYGAPDELWGAGANLNSSVINSSDFGFRFMWNRSNIFSGTTIDRFFYVRMKVYYEPPEESASFFMFF